MANISNNNFKKWEDEIRTKKEMNHFSSTFRQQHYCNQDREREREISNISCTTNVHTLYNNPDMEMIYLIFLFLFCRKHYSFFIVKIIFMSALLYKVCTFVVHETLLEKLGDSKKKYLTSTA